MIEWRSIPFSINAGALNMAFDEVALESRVPTIRFYKWLPSCVSLGVLQDAREVNLEKAQESGIDVTRRITGGRAVLHDEMGELTYSVIAPETEFPKDLLASYREICGWLQAGFEKLGVTTSLAASNDLVVNQKKISGNAQVRVNGMLLQHGTIVMYYDAELTSKVLTRGKVSPAVVREKVTSFVY